MRAGKDSEIPGEYFPYPGDPVRRTIDFLIRADLIPVAVCCTGILTKFLASTYSLAYDKVSGEYVVGKLILSLGGTQYHETVDKAKRASVLRSVFSTTLSELKEPIERGRVLVIPRMYKRELKELTP